MGWAASICETLRPRESRYCFRTSGSESRGRCGLYPRAWMKYSPSMVPNSTYSRPCFRANSQGTVYGASEWRQLSTCMPSLIMGGLLLCECHGLRDDRRVDAEAGTARGRRQGEEPSG